MTGGSGLLGVNWAAELAPTHEVTLGLHNRIISMPNVKTARLTLQSLETLTREIEKIAPECIIHTVALTSVEGCERNPQMAYHINVELAENVATAASRLGVQMVHISSDHLFDGKSRLLREDAKVAPLNIYAHTKAQAENRVLLVHPSALIIRTNFYGIGPPYRQSFSDHILNCLRTGDSITLFDDVFYSPIVISKLIQITQMLQSKSCSGIYNVVSDERISKYQFGLKLASVYGFGIKNILRGSISLMPGLVNRPLDMSLSSGKATAELCVKLGSVEEHLIQLKSQESIVRRIIPH